MSINKKKFIDAVSEVAKIGIGREHINTQQGYKFRSADDILNVVTPIFAKNGIYLEPIFSVKSREKVPTSKGTATETTVELNLSFYDAECEENGLITKCTTFGEARDSGDKCIMKAQTAALKCALTYTLGIPVIGTDDGDFSGEPEMPYNKRMSTKKEVPESKIKKIEEVNEVNEVKEEKKAEKPQEKKAVVEEDTNEISISNDQKEMLRSLGIEI